MVHIVQSDTERANVFLLSNRLTRRSRLESPAYRATVLVIYEHFVSMPSVELIQLQVHLPIWSFLWAQHLVVPQLQGFLTNMPYLASVFQGLVCNYGSYYPNQPVSEESIRELLMQYFPAEK